MSHNIFISIHRLDSSFIDFIAAKYSEDKNDFVSLFELKNKGAGFLIQTFLSYRKYNQVIIVFNDENFCIVEHLFYVLSCFIPKTSIKAILPDLHIINITLWQRLRAVGKMLVSAMETRTLARMAGRDTDLATVCKSKSYAELTKNSQIYYLKTNLSFGTKAGGSVGHVSGVVNALGKKVDLLYLSAEPPVMIDDNIKKQRVSLDGIIYSLPYELNSLKINNCFIRNIEKRIIKKGMPDCIYQRLTLFNYSGAYLANKYRIPLIIEYNGSEVWVQNNWGNTLKYSNLAEKIEQYVLQSADTIITVSEVLRDELIERGFEAKKIVFYPNCIDPEIYDYQLYNANLKSELRKKLGFSDQDNIFTFIGTFGKWHGVDFLADAIVELAQNHREELERLSLKFLLIGDGLLGREVREKLDSEDIKYFVRFTGLVPQHEAPKYLSISDCFLSPHAKQKGKFIGSPTKLFEYMAFAKPIIASELDQVGEVFEHKLYADQLTTPVHIDKESAIVFKPGNLSEFTQAILYVAEYGESLKKMGQNAFDMVMEKYTWEKHVAKIIDCFKERNCR